MNSFCLHLSIILCICVCVCVYVCVCVCEREREIIHIWVQYLMPSFMLSLSIRSSPIYTEKLFTSKLAITVLHGWHIHSYSLSFLLNIFIPVFSTSQHNASSSNSKCYLVCLFSVLIWQTSILNHYPCLCQFLSYPPCWGCQWRDKFMLWKLGTFVFCVCLAGHCHLWLLSPLSLKCLLSWLTVPKVFIRKEAVFEYVLKSTEQSNWKKMIGNH